MILPGTLIQPTVEIHEAAQSYYDSEIDLNASADDLSVFSAVLHDVPDDDPDDGLSTPDVTQPLGMVQAQSMPKDAQQLPAEIAGGRLDGAPPGPESRRSDSPGARDGLQSSGVAWPLGGSSRTTSAENDQASTPIDSMPRAASQLLRPGIASDSMQSVTMPVSLEVERVELSLQMERSNGADARAMLASRADRSTQPEATRPGIIRSMTTMALQHGGAMRIRLDPPALGELIVQMNVNRGHVTLSIQATTMAGAEALAGDLGALKAGLEQRGFVVDRVTVSGPRVDQDDMTPLDSHEQQSPDDEEDATHDRRRHRRKDSDNPPASMDSILETVLELEQGARP